jgi:hypothetical protein
VSGGFSTTGSLLPAPGAGLRYRGYWAKIIYTGGAANGFIADSRGSYICFVGPSPIPSLDFADLKESGLAWPTNTAVTVAVGTGGNFVASILYTVETV